MSAMASQITSVSIVCLNVCSGADQRKHQSSASLAFVTRIHRSPVDSPHKGTVTRKMFPLDDVIMSRLNCVLHKATSAKFDHKPGSNEYSNFFSGRAWIFLTHDARWRIYASVDWVFIGSGNGLPPAWHLFLLSYTMTFYFHCNFLPIQLTM